MNRLGIYFIYDKDGFINNYVIEQIKKIRPFYNEFCIVVNGKLKNEQELKCICDKLIIRENIGMDVGAYKEAMGSYGREKIAQYDEMLLMNYTCFAPFYDLSEMYSEMDKRDCDLWSIFKWPTFKDYHNIDSLICNHLPTFFISYRKSVLKSEKFKDYWENLPPIKTYEDSCKLHEQKQTTYFENLGFKTDAYIDNLKYKNMWLKHFPYSCMYEMIKLDRCPFIKCRHFFFDRKHIPDKSYEIEKILEYLKSINYDINMIFDAVIRRVGTNNFPRIKPFWYLTSLLGNKKHKRRIESYSEIKNYIQELKLYQQQNG